MILNQSMGMGEGSDFHENSFYLAPNQEAAAAATNNIYNKNHINHPPNKHIIPGPLSQREAGVSTFISPNDFGLSMARR